MPVLIIACVLIAVILVASVKIIGQAEVMVVERLGRFNRIARSGLNLLVPFIERPRSIDVRFFETDVGGARRVIQSAQARLSARVLTLLPVAFAGWGIATDSRVRAAYAMSPLPGACTACGLLLDLAGWWWMRRLVRGAV